MITFVQKGNFSKTDKFLERMLESVHHGELDKYGKMGVEALSAATPKDSGETANSWYYNIERKDGVTSIIWSNSHIEKGCNIAILLQYGHGTKSGSYIQGKDYINPTMRPVFEEIANSAWKEVTKS